MQYIDYPIESTEGLFSYTSYAWTGGIAMLAVGIALLSFKRGKK
jgi:hypothetical protein